MVKSLGVTRSLFLLLAACTIPFSSGCSNVSVKDDWTEYNVAFAKGKIPVCHGYGCKQFSQVKLQGTGWQAVQRLFSPQAQSPQQERQVISKAIALMEQLTGKSTGTWNDKAENSGTGEPGQQDCIDESTNTTAYLKLFEQSGWLKWHQIEDRVMRSRYFVDIHWTAVIRDNQSQQRYAVDSWFRANGQEPVIIKLENWLAKRERL